MTKHENLNPVSSFFQRGDQLALGFGTTAAMWAVGYVCHIPPVLVASPVVLALLLLCLFVGGFIAGRTTSGGWRMGLHTGMMAGILNLLILGSLISGNAPNQIVPSALWWIPGSFLVCAGLGALGGAAATSKTGSYIASVWTSAFAWVAASATLMLIAIGGLVTGHEAGLAVVDWPNSFGYNMFLYPLSRMTGGIYFEHAHRLFGSLVGLTTVFLTLHISKVETRRWVKGLSWAALVMVIVQGILGGLRVTGHFTLSDSPQETNPNIYLAIVHGVFAQIFLATLATLAVVSSVDWRQAKEETSHRAVTEWSLAVLLIGVVLVQIMTGAVLRHIAHGLLVHISFAMLTAAVAITCGVRAWGLYPEQARLQKAGLFLLWLICLQILFGLLALVAIGIERPVDYVPTHLDAILTTVHQTTGAVVLAASTVLMLWVFRVVKMMR